MLAYAQQVIVVPGYGIAVAQAQHSVRDLADHLEKRGVEVKYAIHPVAGRMPGHMNVLLAEANVPYPALYDMEDINPEFPQHRRGARDRRQRRDQPGGAQRAESARSSACRSSMSTKRNNIVVLKRCMKPGFAGIDNPLYEEPKTVMLFGDAKKSVDQLTGGGEGAVTKPVVARARNCSRSRGVLESTMNAKWIANANEQAEGLYG